MSTADKYAYRSIGILFSIIDLLWLYFNAERFYGQNYGGILYLVMIPDKLLIINMLMSVICLFFSINMYRNKISVNKGVVINVVLIGVGFLLGLYSTC